MGLPGFSSRPLDLAEEVAKLKAPGHVLTMGELDAIEDELLELATEASLIGGRALPVTALGAAPKVHPVQFGDFFWLPGTFKALMRDYGIRVSQVSSGTGLTPGHVSQLRTMVSVPGSPTLYRLAYYLGMTMDDLFDRCTQEVR